MKVSEWTIRDFRNNFFGRTAQNNEGKTDDMDDSYNKDAFDIEMEKYQNEMDQDMNDKREEFQKLPNLQEMFKTTLALRKLERDFIS